MKILVYGAGVIGSVYAARLQETGHTVTILARGNRMVALHRDGILLKNARTKQQTITHLSVVDQLAPTDTYDLAIVAVRMDQLSSILPALAANRSIPTILFLVNNPMGMQTLHTLDTQRIVLGFPGVGGVKQAETIQYSLIKQQPTTLGEVDGQISARAEHIAAILKKAGFAVAYERHMEAWLKTHAVFVACVSAALAMEKGDSVRLARRRESVVIMVKAIKEGYAALHALGITTIPLNLKILFLRMPTWFVVLYWQYALRTEVGTLDLAPHAQAAQDEMRQVATQITLQLHTSSILTPTLNRLFAFLEVPHTEYSPCGAHDRSDPNRPHGHKR